MSSENICDASQLAMSAVVYLGVGSKGSVNVVCSKTKVAPLKSVTIPRLELSAAVLLVKLMKYVRTHYEVSNSEVFLWTDFSITLI